MSEDALRAAAEAVIEAWGAADQAYEMVGAIGALNDALASSRPEPRDVALNVLDEMIARRRSPDYEWLPVARDEQTPAIRQGTAAARAYQRGELNGMVIARGFVRAALAPSRPEPLDVERAAETWTGEIPERNDANFTVASSQPEPLDALRAEQAWQNTAVIRSAQSGQGYGEPLWTVFAREYDRLGDKG